MQMQTTQTIPSVTTKFVTARKWALENWEAEFRERYEWAEYQVRVQSRVTQSDLLDEHVRQQYKRSVRKTLSR